MPQAATYNRSVDTGSMPDRIRRLPISPEGFPVPWFVTWFDDDGKPCADGKGTPDFRVISPVKMRRCMDHHVCWTCGGVMGVHKSFVIGPMCAINKIISEPPSHRECAIYAARVCPFLANPAMRRNEKGLQDDLVEPAGFGLKRNPGAVCVWITRTYQPFKPPGGGVLFSLGRPSEVHWFARGQRASRSEVLAAIESGYPTLLELARQEGTNAMAALETQRAVAMALVPD